MKELFEVLKNCTLLSNEILSLQQKQDARTVQERNELKFKKEIMIIQLKYLDELIKRELEGK